MDKEHVRRRSWSTISAAARSTCPFSRSATGVIEVLATAGDNHLGGDDFDQRIVRLSRRRVQKAERRRRPDASDQAAMQRVKEAAEKAKIELSSHRRRRTVNLPVHRRYGRQGPLHLEVHAHTRRNSTTLTYDLVQSTRRAGAASPSTTPASPYSEIEQAFSGRRLHAHPGGVRIMCASITGKEPFKGINPDECVAMGACCAGRAFCSRRA